MTVVSVILAILVIGALISYERGLSSSKKAAFAGRNEPARPTLDPEFIKAHWAEIQQMLTIGPTGMKNALMEADKLLDHVMIAQGFKGKTMGDRLKSGGNAFSDLNAIWSAHKLRNHIAHEVAIDIVPTQIKGAVEKLGQGIKDLGVSL